MTRGVPMIDPKMFGDATPEDVARALLRNSNPALRPGARGKAVAGGEVWVTSTVVYRDTNRKACSVPEPKWCPFSFPAEEEPAPPGPEAVQQSANLAEEAVERIHRTCQDAMASFSDDRNSDA